MFKQVAQQWENYLYRFSSVDGRYLQGSRLARLVFSYARNLPRFEAVFAWHVIR